MKIFIVILSIILFISCKREVESPYIVAQDHCNCIDSLFTNLKDSSIDISKCESVYSKSRFMNIWMNSNEIEYNATTKDSAAQFALQVRDIEDSICYNRISYNRIRGKPHIKME